MSDYVRDLRAQIGNDFLLLPAVTAVIQRDDRFLLARQRDSGRWSLVGGGVEPGEPPAEALRREVHEELGVDVVVGEIVGAYGGPALETTYSNGDRAGYVTIAYRCRLASEEFALEEAELIETMWATRQEIFDLERHAWIDDVLRDGAWGA